MTPDRRPTFRYLPGFTRETWLPPGWSKKRGSGPRCPTCRGESNDNVGRE